MAVVALAVPAAMAFSSGVTNVLSLDGYPAVSPADSESGAAGVRAPAASGAERDGRVSSGDLTADAASVVEQRVIEGTTFRPLRGSTVATAALLIPEVGPGVFQVAGAPVVAVGPEVTSYRVEVERGLPFDVEETATLIEATLSDPRSWTGSHTLARVDGAADLRIVVATPETADALCAPLDTAGRLSCRNGANVVLNGWRWAFGAESYGVDLSGYRRYLVNHETGHALGYPHVGCSAQGAMAPVMLQQTKGLEGCRPNPWPARVDLRPGE